MNASLLPAGIYVVCLGRLESPGYKRRNLAEQVEIISYYVITRETLVHKSIYDHLTRMATIDEMIYANASKAQRKAKNSY